jgi:hypothetical protein
MSKSRRSVRAGVDIQIQFAGFHFYIELKADETAVPVEEKPAYIKQTVAYQASDVRIGLIVVLRLTPPKDKAQAVCRLTAVRCSIRRTRRRSRWCHNVWHLARSNWTRRESTGADLTLKLANSGRTSVGRTRFKSPLAHQ